jgi:hypothetical protein
MLWSVSARGETGMSWDYMTVASVPWWYVLEWLAVLAFGDPRGGYWPGPGWEWHERVFYVGVVPLAAAALVRGRWRWACWSAALIALALALGRYGPFYAWAQAVLPGYTAMRVPSRHLLLTALALVLAASLGVRQLRGWRIAAVLGGVAIVLLLAALWPTQLLGLMCASIDNAEAVQKALGSARPAEALRGALARAGVLFLLAAGTCLLPRRLASVGVLLITGLELTLLLAPFRVQHNGTEVTGDPRVRALAAYGRAAVIGDSGMPLASHGPILKFEQPAGYLPLYSSAYALLVIGNPFPGAGFNVQRDSEPILELLGYAASFESDSRRLSVLSPAPPLAWVARCARPGGAREVRAPDFPRRSCVTLAGAGSADEAVAPGEATLLSRSAGELRAEAEGPGWLVTVEPWYPGWRAWIDGSPSRVEVVDGALVGVELPAGEHRIELSYAPAGLEAGLAVSALTLVGLVGLLTVPGWAVRRIALRLRAPRARD